MKTKEIDERFDKEFPNCEAEFCGCYEGDLSDKWIKGRKKLIKFISTLRQSVLEEVREKMPKKREILWGQDRVTPMMDNPVFAVIRGTLSNGQEYEHITDIVENYEITRKIQECMSTHNGELSSEVFDAKVFSHTDMESEIFNHDYHINPENREDVGFNDCHDQVTSLINNLIEER